MKHSKRKKSATPNAKATIERRKNESLMELAGMYNSKKFNKIRKKTELTVFRERGILAEERARIKDSEKNLDENLTEIETKRLEFISKNALYPPPKMIKLPEDFVDKPIDNQVSNYRKNVLDKQKKYWG